MQGVFQNKNSTSQPRKRKSQTRVLPSITAAIRTRTSIAKKGESREVSDGQKNAEGRTLISNQGKIEKEGTLKEREKRVSATVSRV